MDIRTVGIPKMLSDSQPRQQNPRPKTGRQRKPAGNALSGYDQKSPRDAGPASRPTTGLFVDRTV